MHLASRNNIQQYQSVMIYSNFKPAWLFDITLFFKLQFFRKSIFPDRPQHAGLRRQDDLDAMFGFNQILFRIIVEFFTLSPFSFSQAFFIGETHCAADDKWINGQFIIFWFSLIRFFFVVSRLNILR